MSRDADDRGPRTRSSRVSPDGAGWTCLQQAEIMDLFRTGYKPQKFSWIAPKMLWASRNDRIARWIKDSTDEERQRWVQAQIRRGVDPALTIEDHADQDEVSFLMLGDTGEGDASQYHVVRPLLARSEGISFTWIVSDVVYPAGDVDDYEDKFFVPYRQLPGPIYAIPGNHDWYDGLQGFMALLCNANPGLRSPDDSARGWKQKLRGLVWRQPRSLSAERLDELRRLRSSASKQSAPYFAVELKDLLLVGIDTGIRGVIDADQAAWLRRVSAVPKDKILVTGKPLVVNGERRTIGISGSDRTVNEIVADPGHRYIATIAGDIHNYQRYPVRSADGRLLQHIVTGAGGAYTKATHTISEVTVEGCGCDEADFRCYPLRGDSLAAYSILYDRRFGLGRGKFVVPRQEAPVIMAEHLRAGLRPTRAEDRDVAVSERARRAARVILPATAWAGPFYRFFSEFMDWDAPDPPLFKSFLRVDVRPGEVELRCYAATGCAEHEGDPPLEDRVRGTRTASGDWFWEVLPLTDPDPTREEGT